MANRRFQGYADARRTSRTLLADEPRLGRSFIRGEKNQHTATASDTIKARLISELGARGYGRLLERMHAITVADKPERKPRRSRPRRRP